MKQVFADTLYWVASITPGDPWHAPTLRAVAALGPVHLVTTEEVLVEFLSGLRWTRRVSPWQSPPDCTRHPGQRPCDREAADARVVYDRIGCLR